MKKEVKLVGQSNHYGKVLIAAAMLIIFAAVVFADDMGFEEGIHLIRPNSQFVSENYFVPEYLSVEDLTFVSCIDDDDIVLRPSVLCLDNNNFEDLEAYRWSDSDNCYVSSMNLADFDCSNLRIQAEYTLDDENKRMTEGIRVNKISKVLDKLLQTQYSDGGWKTSKDTAYGLWGISHFPVIFHPEMEKAFAWLELERNEEDKCFPQSPCNLGLTLEILYALKLSGYDDARRVVNDARNWVESRQDFYETGDTFSVELNAFVPNSTVLLAAKNDEVLDQNFSISNGTSKTLSFEVDLNDTLYVISPDNFEAKIRNKYGDVVFTYIGNNLSHTFEGACWSANKKGEPCNAEMTAFATQFDLHEENLIEARRWMATQINFSNDVGAYYGLVNTTIDTSLFLSLMHNMTDYDLYKDNLKRYTDESDSEQYARYIEDLTNWLLFKQNNEGSWGDSNATVSEKAKPTAFSVLAFIAMGYNRTFEPIQDAERWMSDNEDSIALNDTQALGSAFYILRHNARPLLVPDPEVIEIKDAITTVQLYNPTTFDLVDLTYNLSSNLKDYLEIDEKKSISAYSYRQLKITRKGGATNDVYGYLEIRNLDDPVAKIPVIITDYPTINVTAESDMTVFGGKAQIKLTVKKSDHQFVCSMKWDSDELRSPASFKITKDTATLDVTFAELVSKEELYKGVMTCKARDQEFEMPISVYITRYASLPLSLSPDMIFINSTSQDIVFSIKNNLDRDITPTITLSAPKGYFDYPDTITLNPNEERNITIKNNIPVDSNYTASLNLEANALDTTKSISIVVDVMQEPPKPMNLMALLSVLIAVLIFLGGISYLLYKKRDLVLEYINRFNVVKTKQELKTSINKLDKIRYDEKTQAITNLVQLLKFQKKGDAEIKKILLSNFSAEEIRDAAKKGNLNVSGLEDEVPEHVEK